MKHLPRSLSMETLLGLSLPKDLTLYEVKAHALTSPALLELRARLHPHKRDRLRIRFVWSETNDEVPDTMTLGEFQRLSKANLTHIAIDDLGGGMPVVPA